METNAMIAVLKPYSISMIGCISPVKVAQDDDAHHKDSKKLNKIINNIFRRYRREKLLGSLDNRDFMGFLACTSSEFFGQNKGFSKRDSCANKLLHIIHTNGV